MAKKTNKEPAKDNVPDVVVAKEETEHILDQLFDSGFTTTSIDILPGKAIATLRNLSAKDQLDIEKKISKIDGSTAYILHHYSLELLAKTVVEYSDCRFTTDIEAYEYLEKLPSIVLDKLVKAQNSFEHRIRKSLQIEETENHFFETPSTQNVSERLPGE